MLPFPGDYFLEGDTYMQHFGFDNGYYWCVGRMGLGGRNPQKLLEP